MSCTTNPSQKFTQFRDKSIQRDALRGPDPHQEFRARQRSDLSREFQAFAQGAPAQRQFEWESQIPVQSSSQMAAQTPEPMNANPQMQDWTSQFASMSIQHAPQQPDLQLPSVPSHTQYSPFNNFAPRFHYSEAPTQMAMNQASTSVPAATQDQDFERAFAAAEARMSALTSQMSQSSGNGPVESSDNIHHIAKEVLDTVEKSTTTDAVAEKLRKSDFMNLMVQLRNREMVVKDNEIVQNEVQKDETSGWNGPKVDSPEIKRPIYEEIQISRAALAPQQDYTDSKSAPPKSTVQPANADEIQESTKPWDPVRGQQPKEDVEDYLNRLGTPDEQLPSVLSPFQAANELGPIPVSVADWEEDYSAWIQ